METITVPGSRDSRPTEKTPFNTSEFEVQEEADRWHVSFRVPFAMISFMLLGVAFAVAHHCYYDSLQGRLIEGSSQEWAVRIGTGLAFLAKACLIASAAMSYQQHYWVLLRSRPVTLKGIDDIMGLLANPACFFNLEVLMKAWSSAVIALAIWCLPLSAITPPASLTATISTARENLISPVPIVNWSNIAYAYGGYGYYVSPQPPLIGAVASSAYTGSILPMVPQHANYTYTLTFQGPRFRCGDSVKTNTTSALNFRPNYNASKSALDYELLVALKDQTFACQIWNVTYSVDFSFVNHEQSSDITGIQFNERWKYVKPERGDPCQGGVCGFRAWYDAVSSVFEGKIGEGASTSMSSTTRLSETAMMNCVPDLPFGGPDCPTPSLQDAIETFSENATLSIFGRMHLVYSNGTGTTTTSVEITHFTTYLTYAYNMRSLLLSYAAAVFATLLILLAGLVALWSNGVGHTSSFSGLIRTTRNKALDEWAKGHCLGADPLDKVLGKQKLQYGLLIADDSTEGSAVRHAAFGFSGTVTKLKKGDRCM